MTNLQVLNYEGNTMVFTIYLTDKPMVFADGVLLHNLKIEHSNTTTKCSLVFHGEYYEVFYRHPYASHEVEYE